jgi:hypothetical protein
MKPGLFRRSWAVALCLALLAPVAHAGEAGALTPGQRLRVTAAAPGRFTGVTVGTLVKLESDTVTLVDGASGAVTELPTSSILRVEVSQGRRRHTRRGLLIGAGIGLLAGALAWSGYSETGCGRRGETYRDCPQDTAGAIAVFATSAAVGAWLGHRKQTEQWADAPLQRLSLSVRPARRGAAVALAMSF